MSASDPADALDITEETSRSSSGSGWSRIATGAFTVIAVMGILGLTGGGPLSRAQTESEGGQVSVEYDRFLRLAGPVKLEVQLGADRGATEIVLDDAYLEGFDMENVRLSPIASPPMPGVWSSASRRRLRAR